MTAFAELPAPTITAKITARGPRSTVPDDAGAVDATLYVDGLDVGDCTLLPRQYDGRAWSKTHAQPSIHTHGARNAGGSDDRRRARMARSGTRGRRSGLLLADEASYTGQRLEAEVIGHALRRK